MVGASLRIVMSSGAALESSLFMAISVSDASRRRGMILKNGGASSNPYMVVIIAAASLTSATSRSKRLSQAVFLVAAMATAGSETVILRMPGQDPAASRTTRPQAQT